MTTNHLALQKAVDALGGQLALARALGTAQSNVWTWLKESKRGTPAEWVASVERVSGVPRHELRPDLYPVPCSTPANEVAA